MSEGNELPRDTESFNTYTAQMLRTHSDRLGVVDTRLEAIERQNTDIYDILQMGKGFFKVCKYIGIGLKWLAGVAVAILAILQFIHHFLNGPPPGSPPP